MLEARLGNYFSHEGKFLFGMMVGGLSVILAAYLELLRRSMPVMERTRGVDPKLFATASFFDRFLMLIFAERDIQK